jgi:PAS domain S-box-containing protein
MNQKLPPEREAVVVTNASGVVTFLNPRAEVLTGWGQDAVGRHLAEVFRIIDETTGQLAENPLDAVLRKRTTVNLADRTLLVPRDGAPIAIDDSAAPIRDPEGRINGVVLVFRDAVDRMEADEALRASEVRYRRLFETAQDAILILDGESGRIVDANPFVNEFLGFEHAELMFKELWQIGLFESSEANQFALKQLHDRGYLHYDQLPLKTKNGVRAEAECVGIVYEMDRKEFIQFNIHDITARVLAEEGLRAARDRFRSVVDHVIHGIISIDEAGAIESVNPAAERLFGYPASEMIGRNVNLLMPEPYHNEHDSYLANYLRTGQAKIIGIGREVLGLRKDGSVFPMELAVSTFPLGKRRLFTGIVQDITDRKQLEEELRQRVAQLREADRRKNEFLAMLAHELRNPLAPIHNAVQLLRKNCPEDEETKWAHDVIERQVQHITRMVDDLLDVSRITRGKINLRREPINVAIAVARAVEMVQPLIDARKHQLTTSLPAEPIWLEADAPRLAQVLANLLNNAAKYTEEGGQIWLAVETDGSNVRLKVRDSGIGIPPDYLPHVFDLFSQEDSSFGRTQGGLGIGLTLVRSLVRMHGGAIEAFSPGIAQGSEFVVRLPRLLQAPLTGATAAKDGPAMVAPPRRILVVDDNVDGARSLSILLRHAGHDVHTANDGPAALELIRTWQPQVVLLDIGMPRMSGLEVARILRRDLGMSKVLLVAMTGYGQDDDRQRSEEAGFNAHMVKPLDLDALQLLLARPEGDG